MIAFDEASAIVAAQARPLGVEHVPLAMASGRVLAGPCIAQVDSPPADISAMDGYALRDADIAREAPFRIIGNAYPGAPFEGVVGDLECVRLFTGAPVPVGCDRVVIQEEVRREGDQAVLLNPPPAKRHIRRRGTDFTAGDTLLPPGRRLDPRALVAAAGADLAELPVWRMPRVVLLSTGDELVPPGQARDRPSSIPDSLSYGVAALADAWGATVVGRHRLRDDVEEMAAEAGRALETADLVVVTGGASVGEKDHAKRVFADLGTEILFSKVAIMPGKPVWFGRAGSTLVLGLPGNPSSAMVTARLFLAPLLAGMSGRDPGEALRWRQAVLAEPVPQAGERETFIRASGSAERVSPGGNQDSGMQLVLADSPWLIRRAPRATALPAGAMVDILDF